MLNEKTIFNKASVFMALFVFLLLAKNIFISGCIVFPIPFLCFENIPWSNYNLVINERLAAEAWSKSWPNQNNFTNFESFNSNYNWLNTWLETHLIVIFEKFSPIITFVIIFYFIFLIKGKNLSIDGIKQIKTKFFLLYLISFLNLILWFNFFPIYRYGYSFIMLFFLLTFLIFFVKFIRKPEKKFVNKYYISILLISFTFFGLKNFDRIIKNYQIDYDNKPFPNIKYSYYINENPKIEEIKIDNFIYYYAPDLCFYNKAPCTNYKINNIEHKKLFNYDLIVIN